MNAARHLFLFVCTVRAALTHVGIYTTIEAIYIHTRSSSGRGTGEGVCVSQKGSPWSLRYLQSLLKVKIVHQSVSELLLGV